MKTGYTFVNIFLKYNTFHPKNVKNQHFCFPASELMHIFYIFNYTMSDDSTPPYLNLMDKKLTCLNQ